MVSLFRRFTFMISVVIALFFSAMQPAAVHTETSVQCGSGSISPVSRPPPDLETSPETPPSNPYYNLSTFHPDRILYVPPALENGQLSSSSPPLHHLGRLILWLTIEQPFGIPNASQTTPNHTAQVLTTPRPLLNDHRTMLSASRLPSDIWFLIFDELAEVSPGTLNTCASVSRSFSSLAQRHTFSRIRLRGNRGFNKWSSHIMQIMPDDSEPGLSHVKRSHYNC